MCIRDSLYAESPIPRKGDGALVFGGLFRFHSGVDGLHSLFEVTEQLVLREVEALGVGGKALGVHGSLRGAVDVDVDGDGVVLVEPGTPLNLKKSFQRKKNQIES